MLFRLACPSNEEGRGQKDTYKVMTYLSLGLPEAQGLGETKTKQTRQNRVLHLHVTSARHLQVSHMHPSKHASRMSALCGWAHQYYCSNALAGLFCNTFRKPRGLGQSLCIYSGVCTNRCNMTCFVTCVTGQTALQSGLQP